MTDEIKIDAAGDWLDKLKVSKKEDEKFVKRGKKIVRRYRDERTGWADTTKRYNILWSNIQTMLPALYGKTPRAQVERRFKDQDPVGRTASIIIERALQFEIDHYGDFDASIKAAVLDRLLPGRGTTWIRFESVDVESPETDIEQKDTQLERTCSDYVYWEDFRCSPARVWDEVTWVARRVYLSRKEGTARFGEEFSDVPLTHEPIGLDEDKSKSQDDANKKAQVWEIWDKSSETVIWVAEGHSKTLDEKEDPYGLDGFWPCPKPLYATQSTDTLVPVPDYALYQDQADELDKLTNRIHMLVEAVKVVGVYDSSQPGIQRMLNEGVNNTLIPVDNWAAFGEKGGLKGTVDFMPLDSVLMALRECYVARDQAKQVIYEVTGLSDIIRGASVASETATAQQIKSQYASLRLKSLQIDVAKYASAILQIKAQLMCDLYSPETLVNMSGIMGTQDAQHVPAALELIKSEPARSFRIEVASDSLVEMDEQAEKASRMEFLQATGAFMEKALPVAQAAPDITPLIAEMLLFGVRAFKGGRPMEAAFDDAMAKLAAPKPPATPPPDPEQIKAQAQMQIEQGKMQLEQAKLQGFAEIEQFKANQTSQLEQMKMSNALQIEQMKQEAETQRAQFKAELEAQTKLQIASMAGESAINAARESSSKTIDDKAALGAQGFRDDILNDVQEMLGQLTQTLEQSIATRESTDKTVIRDEVTGKPIAVKIGNTIKPIKFDAKGRISGV